MICASCTLEVSSCFYMTPSQDALPVVPESWLAKAAHRNIYEKGEPTEADVFKDRPCPSSVFIDRLCFLILVFSLHSKFTGAVDVPLEIDK